MFLDTFSILNGLFYQILTFFENKAFSLDVEKDFCDEKTGSFRQYSVAVKGIIRWLSLFFSCGQNRYVPEPVHRYAGFFSGIAPRRSGR